MADVEGYREEPGNLGNQRELLPILGRMNGTGTNMTATRQRFQRLTSKLLAQVGLEPLKKTVQEMDGKAQVCVDIVIRHLFERTVCMDRVDTGCSILESPDSYVECIIKPAPEAQKQDLLAVLDPDRLVRALTQSKN
ncbi:hypothetical protein [Desulfocurvus sp. DL9XJH121]